MERGLPPERERDYILSVETAEEAVAEGRLALARQLIGQLEQDFPHLAIGGILRCELGLLGGHLGAAQATCAAAVKLQEDAAPAHLLSALVDGRLGRCRQATAEARRALALDPALAGALQPLQARCLF